MIKFALKISMIVILCVLILSTFSCTETKVVKPIVIDTPKNSTFKVSATITNTSTNLVLGGSATATINLKNDSLSPINVSLVASLSNSQLIDSIFIDEVKVDLLNGKISFSKLIGSSITNTVNLRYVVKQNLSTEQTVQGQISTITIDTISYDGQSKKVSTSANLFTLNLLATAFVNLAASQASSNTAIDTFVVGKSVAEGFNLNVIRAGTAQVEVIGLKTDNTLPLSHYWVTSSTDPDFGVRVSNFNSSNNVILGKTPVNSKIFTINLVAGVNNIVFKTTNLYRAIANGTKVGLRTTLANGITYTSTYTVKSDSVDLADKVVVTNSWSSGVGIGANMSDIDVQFARFNMYPTNEDYSFANKFPKLISAGASTKFYTDRYPLLDFTNKGNSKFVIKQYSPVSKIFELILTDASYTNGNINVKGNPFQLTSPTQTISVSLYLNVFNAASTSFIPGAAGLDPASRGWKFYGNPEMEIYATKTGVIYGFAIDVVNQNNSTRVY